MKTTNVSKPTMSKLEQMQEMAKERLLTSGADGFAIDLDIDELNAVITEVWNEAIKEERERIVDVLMPIPKKFFIADLKVNNVTLTKKHCIRKALTPAENRHYKR